MTTFRKGRDFATWLGLGPKQHSSGGKQVLTVFGDARKRRPPLQEQLCPGGKKLKEKAPNLDQILRPKPYMKAGQFSVKIPGQVSVEINNHAS